MSASVPFNAHGTHKEACHTDSSDQGQLPGILGARDHGEGMLPPDHPFESKGALLLGCPGRGLQGGPGPWLPWATSLTPSGSDLYTGPFIFIRKVRGQPLSAL